MYKLIITLTLLALATVSYAQVTGWTLCPSQNLATINEVRVRGCTVAPCVIVRGEIHYVEVYATSLDSASSLPFNTTVTVLGQTIAVLDGDACDFGVNCPVGPNDPLNFVEELNLPGIVPAISTVATTRVWDQIGRLALCFNLSIQVA